MKTFALVSFSLVFAWTTLRGAGVQLADWNVSVLALMLLAAAILPRAQAPHLERWLAWPAIGLAAWVTIQMIPMPAAVVRVLSPSRAALASAIGNTGAVPLSTFPALTVAEWMRLIGCLFAFLIARELASRFSERRPPWIVVMPLVLIACFEGALGLLQFYGGGAATEGAHGTYISRDHYAGLMEMALPFPIMCGLVVLRRERSRFEAALRPALMACACFACGALILLGSIHSLSRMGFIAALVSASIVAVSIVGDKRWLLATPAVIILLFIYLPTDELIARFSDVSTSEKLTNQDRLEIWRETLPLIAAYPFAGCGLGTFESAFMPYKRSTPLLTDNFAHNDYLQYLAELGIPGFLTGVVLIGAVLARAVKAARRHASPDGRALAWACLASLSALLLHSWVDFNSYIPGNAYAFAWIAGLSVSTMYSSSAPVGGSGIVLNAKPVRSSWFNFLHSCGIRV